MIFADKVIALRKKNGWSQEELSDKMGVSRQAVSKWEGAQTVPDLEKILRLSELFGVTTDYLLKDEIETAEFCGDDSEPPVRKVTLSEANAYLASRKTASFRIAAATFLCILAVIPLLILGAATEVPTFAVSEALAAGIGLVSLFVIVAVAVGLFVYTGFCNAPYEFLDKVPFGTEYGVSGMVREREEESRGSYTLMNLIATLLCVLSPVPLFIGAFSEKEFLMVILLSDTLLIAGIGAVLFILAGVPHAARQRLLKEGEFSAAEKKKSSVTGTVSLVYWLTATAIYLIVSFVSEDWEKSWIVWAAAGVLYAAVLAVCRMIADRHNKV